MEKIIIKPAGVVKVKVTVDNLVIWACKYYDIGSTGTVVYDMTSAKDTVEIGDPKDLDGNTENWDVRVSNPGSRPQNYSVLIEWIQNDIVVHTWSPKGGPVFTVTDTMNSHQDSGDIMKK